MMNLPRRRFLQLTGAAIAAPTVGRIPPVQAEAAFRQVEKLAIKGEEIQQTANAMGAIFGGNEDDHAGNQRGRSLLWRIRGGGAGDIAWQLAEVSVTIFQRPSPNIAPLEIT